MPESLRPFVYLYRGVREGRTSDAGVTHSEARKEAMVLRTSVSDLEGTSKAEVSTSLKHCPSMKNGKDISTFSLEVEIPLPTRSVELLTALMNFVASGRNS